MATRFSELDGLRGIAALWVVIFHLTFGVHHHWLASDPVLADRISPGGFNVRGLMGVDLFFVISGFVISLTAERCATVSEFARARIARLFPAYWFAVLLTASVEWLDPIPQSSVGLGQVIINLSMLNLFLRVNSVDPSYWSLAVELAFYAMIAVLLSIGRLGSLVGTGVAWLAAATSVLAAFRAAHVVIPWRLDTIFAMSHAGLFYAGILFYRARRHGWSMAIGGLLALCFASRCLILSWDEFAIEAGILMVFALAVAGQLPFLASRPLTYLGAISYSIYLIHQVVGFHLQLAIERTGGPAWANLVATIAILLALASAMTFRIERPGGAVLRRLLAAVGSAGRSPA